jgi:PAS domain S-box-containing protein
MNWLYRLPLRYSLPLLLLTFGLATSLLTYINARQYIVDNVSHEAASRMTATLNESQRALEHLWRTGEPEGVRDFIATFGAEHGQRITALVGPSGDIIASTSLGDIGKAASRVFPPVDTDRLDQVSMNGKSSVIVSSDKMSIDGYAQVCGPASTALRDHRCGFLYHNKSLIAQTETALALLRSQAIKTAAAILTATVLLLGLLHFMLTRRAQHLATSARAFEEGELQIRADLKGNDEFAKIGSAFDSMLNTVVENQADLRLRDQAMAESTNSIVIIDLIDSTGPIVYCNPAFEKITGYSRDEVIGRHWRLIRNDDRDQHETKMLSDAILNHHPYRATLRSYRKDGSLFWNDISVVPIAANDGAVTHCVCIQNDITERKQAEDRLIGFGNALEASINEIFMFDETSLRFVHVNQSARDNLGYSMDELVQLTPVDIKPEFTRQTFEAVVEPLRHDHKKIVDVRTIHQRKDGTTYPVEIHLQRSVFDSNPVFAAIVLDITERTQTEEALAQSRLFLESAPDASVIVNEAGQIEVANSRMTALSGYGPDELHGMPVEVLVPERFRAGHHAHREDFSADPKVRGMGSDLELFIVTKDGREVPIEVSLSPIKTSDGTLVSAAIRDVTRRIAVEHELQDAKDTAERATATKSRFLAAASHDLRQPLQSIGLYISVLNRLIEEPKMQEISGKIRQSLDVMGELLDALLDISKLDSGAIEPSKKDFPIQNLLDQLMADSQPQALNKGLELRCTGCPNIVYSDPVLLGRIVENFITNALRYTQVGYIEIACETRQAMLRIEVRDSGIGMPQEALETIFEEYYQLDNSIRDRRKGLGLGLSIVKHIARLLDHRLDVSSVPGEGSTFAVEVPLGKPVEEKLEATIDVPVSQRGDRQPVVLFVDDDPAIVDATVMLLDSAGVLVYSALDGEQALAHIADGVRPDIVVSDYRLPGFTGVEVIRRVRAATTDDLPTVLMTGDTAAKEIEQANLSHCTVLHKPVDTDRLIALIEGAMR